MEASERNSESNHDSNRDSDESREVHSINSGGQPAFDVYSRREVAIAIQNEVKALLYDYLTMSDQHVKAGIPVLAISEMLKDNRKGLKRQQKQLYHLKTAAEDVVKKAFQEACPMFGEGQAAEPTRVYQDHEVFGQADRFENVIETGHRQIVVSSPSNILIAYQPTLEFMTGMEKKIMMRLANFKMFLEDFIFNVYLPQIQEQVLVYFHANVNGIDAFQADRYPDAPYPLIKSALCIVLEMYGICRTIKCVPIHSNELVKFVEFTLKKFYEKCCVRFKGLLRTEETTFKEEKEKESKSSENEEALQSSNILSVQWATDPEIIALFEKNTYLSQNVLLF